MKKLLWATLVLFLLLACIPENEVVIDSSGIFQLNRFDNIFFTKDNGLLITGVCKNKLTIIKTNSNFGVEWTKDNYAWGTIISGSGWGSAFYSVQITGMFQRSDGSFVCVGSVMEGGCVVDYATLIIELNRKGEQTRKIEFAGLDTKNVLQTIDGGYVLFGTKLTKLDGNYKQLWQKTIYDNDYYPCSIIATTDGGFATTGSYKADQVFLTKYDAEGNEISSHTYKHNDFPFNEAGFDLVQLKDNGFIIAGRTRNINSLYDIDCQIIRTNSSGDTIWTKRFGVSNNDWLESVISHNQSELIIQGNSGFPNENPKVLLFKINYEGQILDSIRTQQFSKLVYSRLEYYVKIQHVDSAHVSLSRIDEDKLFH